jgi:hypothetical protein
LLTTWRLTLPIALGAVVLAPAQSRAEPAEFEIHAAPACADRVGELEARLAPVLSRDSSRTLWASVAIAASGAGYRVTLRTRRADAALAEKVVTLPTCDEAIDAAVVILALAARAEMQPEAPLVTPSVEAALPQPAPPVRTRTTTVRAAAPPPATELEDERSTRKLAGTDGVTDVTRLALASGVDAGTLTRPTLYVAAGLARSFSALELRGLLRYGLPVVEEDQDGEISESHRSDFGALEFSACYGTSSKLRVQACGGAELGAVRSSRQIERAGGYATDESALSPRLSGVLAAVVAHRGGRIQPALEFSGAAAALGRDEWDSWLVLRVAAGAAVEF